MISFDLSKEQLLLQESVYQSAKNIDNNLPFLKRWKYLAQTGIPGICVDQKYGGSGLGAFDMLLALESLANGNHDNGLSFAMAAHTLACVIPLHLHGTEKQKQLFLPRLISGDAIIANAMTESESGSDAFSMQCKAVKKGNTYLLNGTKTFVSNSAVASFVLTYAATNPEKGFFGGITAFLLEKDNYTAGVQFQKMGLDSCSLGEIIFNDKPVSKNAVLGKEGGGGIIFNQSMEWERICLAGIHLGAMQRVLAKTIDFVKQRKSFGQSISKFQGISHALAEMSGTLEVSRTYAYKTAWLLDQKKNVSKESSISKLFISEAVKKFMQQALQIFGGYGYIADYGIEQEVRDSLASTLYSGTSEIQKNIIASNLGL